MTDLQEARKNIELLHEALALNGPGNEFVLCFSSTVRATFWKELNLPLTADDAASAAIMRITNKFCCHD